MQVSDTGVGTAEHGNDESKRNDDQPERSSAEQLRDLCAKGNGLQFAQDILSQHGGVLVKNGNSQGSSFSFTMNAEMVSGVYREGDSPRDAKPVHEREVHLDVALASSSRSYAHCNSDEENDVHHQAI